MEGTCRSYEEFLAADERRRRGALELGHNLSARDACWRACWYEQTGELTIEAITNAAAIRADDFYAGISGPVTVLATIASQVELERILGSWPLLEIWRPRTRRRLHDLVGA